MFYSDDLTPYFEVQWLVPADKAIGGVACWHTLKLPEYQPELIEHQAAVEAYQKALQHYPAASVRLVKFTPELIEPRPTPEEIKALNWVIEADLTIAKENGFTLITQTAQGPLTLRYDSGSFTLKKLHEEQPFVVGRQTIIDTLKTIYDPEYATEAYRASQSSTPSAIAILKHSTEL